MKKKYNKKILSILIPAYCYVDGIENILNLLGDITGDIEILIFDDSLDLNIADLVRRRQAVSPQIIYRHNLSKLGRTLGAAANWNALLDHATGRYLMLMHHDEMPLGSKFLLDLQAVLLTEEAPDIIVLKHYIYSPGRKIPREHVPSWFRKIILKHAPGYLFRRNVIGPTACLVIRREIVPRFDPELTWLIDVDFYYRLFSQKLRWVVAPNLSVASQRRVNGSITATIKSNLKAIDGYERKYLTGFHFQALMWLNRPGIAPVRWVEAVAWGIFRGFQFIFQKRSNNNERNQ